MILLWMSTLVFCKSDGDNCSQKMDLVLQITVVRETTVNRIQVRSLR